MNNTDSHEHATAWPLLPWHAAGRLDGADEAQVAAHVRTCAACQAELAWQRRLHGAAAIDREMPIPDVDAALARLLPLLDDPAPAPRRPARVPALLAALVDWLRRAPLAPAAFALLLVGLSVAPLWQQDGEQVSGQLGGQLGGQDAGQVGGYRALGPVPAAGGDTAVVFRPGTPSADVRRILAATGAGAVHGPSSAGAWVLALGPARQAEALARLRAEPAVLMAEPLEAREGQ